MHRPRLGDRDCPVCGAPAADAPTFLEENIRPGDMGALSFASRKPPEYMCHHMVSCPVCDLVYADTLPAEGELAQAYAEAGYDSAREAEDAADAYLLAMEPWLSGLGMGSAALEIGCGTGIFLQRLRQHGVSTLVGVEPSRAAIGSAPPLCRPWIRPGVFMESDFGPGSFDLICCFMTLEHVPDPALLARSAFRLLRPGGRFVVVVHDRRAWINRLLGKRSPIVDIEHLQLFSRNSISCLLARAGFEQLLVRSFTNRYPLGYWLRLAPLPTSLKQAATALPGWLSGIKVGMNVGNLIAGGRRATGGHVAT